MSISIGHRAIFSAFGHRYTAAPSQLPKVVAPPAAETQARADVQAGELKCSPWEGLYLEQAQPFAAAESESATSRQLDEFLTSLMYGE